MVQIMEQHSPHLAQRPYNDERERVVQVIIVDAHVLIREALQRVIENFPQACVYASLSRMHEGLAILRKGVGDVLILGCSISITECLENVKVAQQIQASLGIVVIRQLLCPETTFPMIRGGVQGLLGEDASAKDLAQAIATVATGSTFLSQRAREILDGYVSHVPLYFTVREMQVLQHLRLGLSNYGIAQQLNLKEKTIEKHLTHIYQKLHIRSRAEAILRLQTLHI